MTIINIKRFLIGSCFIGLGSYALFFYQPSDVIVSNNALDSNETFNSANSMQANKGNDELSDLDLFIKNMSKNMRDKHLHEISSVLVQLSMGDFKLFVMDVYPENGESIFNQIMINAFPQHAQQIFKMLASMQRYNDWHVDMLLTLSEMDGLTKNGTLWRKRHEIFADHAQEIWQAELDSKAAKEQAVQETLALLHGADDMSMSDRLYVLTDTVTELYLESPSQHLISKGMISDVYFNLESVQNDLKHMSQQQREQVIADSRRQIGFSEEDIMLLAKRDAEKEQRWQNGYAYMSARDQLTQLYSGTELNNKLAELRAQYFKHEAPTIEKEEQSDFFRYTRPRLYGSN